MSSFSLKDLPAAGLEKGYRRVRLLRSARRGVVTAALGLGGVVFLSLAVCLWLVPRPLPPEMRAHPWLLGLAGLGMLSLLPLVRARMSREEPFVLLARVRERYKTGSGEEESLWLKLDVAEAHLLTERGLGGELPAGPRDYPCDSQPYAAPGEGFAVWFGLGNHVLWHCLPETLR